MSIDHPSPEFAAGREGRSSKPFPEVRLAAADSTAERSGLARLRRGGHSPAPPAIFIHSSWRTSSTWFWQKFRRNRDALCFYEPFHEALATITEAAAKNTHWRSWQSGHPPGRPYFIEFLPLIRAAGGVRLFPSEIGYDWFFPSGGLDGDLRPAEIRYLALLIRYANRAGKVPVLGCVRSLGRIRPMRRVFPGLHLYLYRNFWDQWMSFLHQRQQGNPTFLHYLRVICNKGDDKFIAYVRSYYLNRAMAVCLSRGAAGQEALASLRAGEFTTEIFDILPEPEVFGLFMALHVYLHLNAWKSADGVVDITKAARDPSYREEISEKLQSKTNLRLDFSDMRETQQFAGFDVEAVRWDEIKEQASLAAWFLRHLGDETELAREGADIVAAAYEEMRASEKYLRNARTEIAAMAVERSRIVEAHVALTTERADLAQRLAAAITEMVGMRESLTQRESECRHFQDEAASSTGRVATLEESLTQRESECRRFQDEAASSAGRVATLEGSLAQRESECRRFQDEAASSAGRVATLEESLAQLEDECRRFQDEAASSAGRAATLEESLTQRESECRRFRDEAASSAGRVATLEESLMQRESECRQLRDDRRVNDEMAAQARAEFARMVEERDRVAEARDGFAARQRRWHEAALPAPQDKLDGRAQYRLQSRLYSRVQLRWLARGLMRHARMLIVLADRARDDRRWETAACRYREALDLAPECPAIWVQYGHALKEAGSFADGEAAYRSALALDPKIADTHLQLGHVLKLQGRIDEAKDAYLCSLMLDPDLRHPLYELLALGWTPADIERAVSRTAVKP